MALNYSPERGRIIVVDFELGGGRLIGAEMSKSRRPCIVVQNNRLHRGPLVTIVPISTTPPREQRPWHHELSQESFRIWPAEWGGAEMRRWAKCDCVTTVALERCSSPYSKDRAGGRRHIAVKITAADLQAVERCVLWALGINPAAPA
jgi:uncharacterized protein YifN (PemK superfamily)